MPWYAGALNTVSWRSSGAGSYTELCDFRHDWSENDEGHEITSSCHDGQQAFIASILRGEGTASFHIKDEQYPWELDIKAQTSGIISIEFGNRAPFFIPVYISRVAYTNDTAGGSDYVVTFKLNKEAAQYGTEYTYPT